jgi:hypothetical protein
VRDSLDEEDALDGNAGQRSTAYDPVTSSNRDVSPLPAPKPQKPIQPPRESLDGETIFAVGEDGDKWSDDELEESSNAEERKKLTGKDA